jgi:putative ABC transport system substrate-binding protein
MRRRDVIVGFGGALLCPLDARAQARLARLAVLAGTQHERYWPGFVAALRERGWIEGENIRFDVRWAEGRPEQFDEFAADLLKGRPDVVMAGSSQAAQALHRLTRTVPIVMAGVVDPVGAGLVASLARPESNATGVSFGVPSGQTDPVAGKRLQLLKETRPGIARIALLWTPENHGSFLAKESAVALAPALGIQLHPIAVNRAEDLEPALAALAQSRPDALEVSPTPVLVDQRRRIAAFALAQGLPTLGAGVMARDGLLMSYAADLGESWRRLADFADRILRGASPGDLPVEQPTKFELVVNLRTARALGLTLPPSLLAAADEVIE